MGGNLSDEEYIERYKRLYWSYYLTLEDRMRQTERFVSFDKENGGTFSTEYLALLQIACSEVDVISKEIDSHFSGISFKKIDSISKGDFISCSFSLNWRRRK